MSLFYNCSGGHLLGSCSNTGLWGNVSQSDCNTQVVRLRAPASNTATVVILRPGLGLLLPSVSTVFVRRLLAHMASSSGVDVTKLRMLAGSLRPFQRSLVNKGRDNDETDRVKMSLGRPTAS